MVESWRDIPELVGYQASCLGNIRSFRQTGAAYRTLSTESKLMKLLKYQNGRYYVKIRANALDAKPLNKAMSVHRLVYLAFIGTIPAGFEIDHKDRNPLNNSISNLRLATRSQNASNRLDRSKECLKGVCLDKRCKPGTKRYWAAIRINGKKVCLGYFKEKRDAALAYNKAAQEHFGEYALLNIV